jgi:PAS domain S-box-containing protein
MSMTVDRATTTRRSLPFAPGAIRWLVLFTLLTGADFRLTMAAEGAGAATTSTNNPRTERSEPWQSAGIPHRPEATVEGGLARRVQSSVQRVTESPPLIALVAVVVAMLLLWGLVALKFGQRRKPPVPQRAEPKEIKPAPPANEASLGKRYRYLFENANDLIQGIALDGKLLYVNSAWQEILDYSDHEISSLSIFQVVHPDCLESFRKDFERAVVGVKIKKLETTFVSKYGKRVIVEGSLHCELVDDRPSAIQGIFRDITERKRSEAALKQSEERFSRVFKASPIAIEISTLDEGRVQDVNDSFLNMLGYTRKEVLSQPVSKLGFWANPEDRARIQQKVKEHKSVRDEQCRLRTKTGEFREALISVELIELGLEPCLLFIIHDNTERISLEAQLRQAQKMEGIGQLAAGVAHDFNNILTIIQGHASRLRTADGLPPKIGESVEQVSFAAERAANLTRQLLTFCRKQAMVPKVMDLNETVTHVSKMLNRILGEDIALDVRCDQAMPPINADSGMMEQILINLAVNSRDAMPKGGHLVISTSALDINQAYVQQRAEARVGLYVCLTVTDNGSGMKPETLRRIFEPFFTTKEVGKGTGLGLATVYGIVNQHHGWLEVASELGKGTTFKIFLPVAEQVNVQVCEKACEPDVRGGKETILLVEDELVVRELARMVLEDYQYRVLEAGSGVQALKVWEEHKHEIDMLLTDMVMPEGMTGRDLAERLQAEKPSIKVLYTSGYSPDVVGGYFKLPENSFFLAKPYDPPKLAVTVRECLDNSSPSNVIPTKLSQAA